MHEIKKILKYTKVKDLKKENQIFLEEFNNYKNLMIERNLELNKELNLMQDKEVKQNVYISNIEKEKKELSIIIIIFYKYSLFSFRK